MRTKLSILLVLFVSAMAFAAHNSYAEEASEIGATETSGDRFLGVLLGDSLESVNRRYRVIKEKVTPSSLENSSFSSSSSSSSYSGSSGRVWVNGYTRKNGTHVKGHWRSK